MAETKKNRTKRSEIPGKIAKVEELKASMTIMEACKAAGISYPAYLRGRGKVGQNSVGTGSQVLSPAIQTAVLGLIKAIKDDLKAKLE